MPPHFPSKSKWHRNTLSAIGHIRGKSAWIRNTNACRLVLSHICSNRLHCPAGVPWRWLARWRSWRSGLREMVGIMWGDNGVTRLALQRHGGVTFCVCPQKPWIRAPLIWLTWYEAWFNGLYDVYPESKIISDLRKKKGMQTTLGFIEYCIIHFTYFTCGMSQLVCMICWRPCHPHSVDCETRKMIFLLPPVSQFTGRQKSQLKKLKINVTNLRWALISINSILLKLQYQKWSWHFYLLTYLWPWICMQCLHFFLQQKPHQAVLDEVSDVLGEVSAAERNEGLEKYTWELPKQGIRSPHQSKLSEKIKFKFGTSPVFWPTVTLTGPVQYIPCV